MSATIKVKDFPESEEAKIRFYMKQLNHLFPTWLHELIVFNERGRETGSIAEANCKPQYHEAIIFLFDNFWNQRDEHDQLDTLKHEIVHILVSPMTMAFENALNSIYPNTADRGPAYNHIKKVILDANEFVTEDLMRLFPDVNAKSSVSSSGFFSADGSASLKRLEVE